MTECSTELIEPSFKCGIVNKFKFQKFKCDGFGNLWSVVTLNVFVQSCFKLSVSKLIESEFISSKWNEKQTKIRTRKKQPVVMNRINLLKCALSVSTHFNKCF